MQTDDLLVTGHETRRFPEVRSEHHNQIAEALPDALLVCNEGKIVYANPSSVRLFGALNAEELTGREFLCLIQPQDLERVRGLLLPYSKVESFSRAARIIRFDGTELIVEIAAAPMRNEMQVLLRRTDADRFDAEYLSLSEQKYRALVEGSPDCVAVTTPEGTILDINKAGIELFGYSDKQAVLGSNIARDFCVDPNQRELVTQALSRQGFIKNFEYEIQRGDGQKRTVLEHVIAVRDSKRDPVSYRSFIRDITEWKQLEQQLFQARKMESIAAMLGGIAHDFINVLNTLQGFAGQLKRHAAETERVLKYAETIDKSILRGRGLVSQLQSFVNQKKRVASQSQAHDVIAEVMDLMHATFPKTISIDSTLEPDLPPLAVDAGALYQALMNICLNARDAMPNGGELHLDAALYQPEKKDPQIVTACNPKQKFVRISIRDNGVGISQAVKDRIFDPFFTTKGHGKGTGLGLSIVYNIVQTYNGSIIVDSHEHQGSTFTMFFPTSDVQSLSPSESGNREVKSLNNELILLVDDETTMQELGKELLEEQGYRVLVARDGAEAVELYQQHSHEISLVILDLLMPRLDGGQAYLELKKINSKVKVFFCSGFTPEEVIGSLLVNEKLTSLQKPFRPEDLIKTVREIISAK